MVAAALLLSSITYTTKSTIIRGHKIGPNNSTSSAGRIASFTPEPAGVLDAGDPEVHPQVLHFT